MPVINGVYTKDFPALGRAPIDTDIIPIAELANQITYKTTLGELFNAKVFGTTGRLSKFTSANTLGNSILNEIGNAIHLTNAGSSFASFGIINPGVPGDPGVDNDAYIGSTINNDFTIRVNNVEAARFDTALRFKITTIQNATTDTDKFLVSDGGVVKYRTGAEVLSDIGAASASAYVPYTGATSNVNLGAFNITASSLIKAGGVDTQFLKADGSVDNNNYLTANDLPSTLSLYATNVAAAVAGYFKLVTTIDDPDYNTIAVDVPTGAITTTDQLIASLVSPVNLINGNPGVFNVTTTGNITRISGSGEAEFFFRIYKRDSGGVETLIGTSSNTIPVINSGYSEFFATAIWNDGIFGVTDSIVLKYYATRLSGGSNPTYQFQFGGDQPVRTIVPIPTAVIPNIFLEELADVEDGTASNNDGIFFDSSVSLWKYKSVAEVLGYTPANDASVVHLDGTETITGRKTFNNVNGLTIDEVSGALVPTKIFSSNIQTLNYAVSNTSNNFLGTFLGTVTANRTYSIPDISGTLALTSQLHDAVTLSAIGSTPNANGATLTGQVLNLQPASASFGGVITTGSQTIGGPKIFSNDIRVNTINIGLGGGAVITNTRVGVSALANNTSGDFNTANGYYALSSNTSGNSNTANGTISIANNTTGSFNTAYGSSSGGINTTGSNNIFLGYNSNGQSATESNRTWIGNTDTTSTWLGGNLLLGSRTNATSDKLQITGGAKITGIITLGTGADSYVYDSGGSLILQTGASPRLTINSAGNALFSGSLSVNGAYEQLNGSIKYIYDSGNASYYSLQNSSTSFLLKYNGSTKLTLNGSGNLGLGVTPSAWGASFKSLEGEFGQSWFYNNSSLATGLTSNAYNNGTNWIYKTPNAVYRYEIGNVGHAWFTAPVGTAGNAISFTQAMTLDAGGNVLIGTTTDAGYKLDVNGTGRFSGALTATSGNFTDFSLTKAFSTSGVASTYTNTSAAAANNSIISDYYFKSTAWTNTLGGQISLIADEYWGEAAFVYKSHDRLSATGLIERFRIASTGAATFSSSVSVGTVSTGKIELSNTTNTPSITIDGGAGSNSIGGAAAFRLGDVTNSKYWTFQIDGSSQLATWYFNGGWTKVGYQTTGGTWTNSDERRKENIEISQYGLKEVLQLIPKKFNFKIDERKIVNLGFIAQDVLPIIPESVQSDMDNEEEYYAMNYANLVPVLVKAIQELNEKITQLENK